MKPDARKTTYQFLKTEDPPKIFFTKKALTWIQCLAELHEGEVGFLGTVILEPDGSYTVKDIFYPKHSEANHGTCEISPEGETLIMEYLEKKNRLEDINRMMLWGHSHGTMGTTPSGQDENQAIERMEQTKTFLLRVIVNKSGELSASFFDYQRKIRFDNIKWEVRRESDNAHYERIIASISEIIGKDLAIRKKFHDIKKIISSDEEVEAIKAKIIQLKKENIPEPKWPNHPFKNQHIRSGGFVQQEEMFDNSRFENGKTSRPFGWEYGNTDDNDGDIVIDPSTGLAMADTEISRAVKNWRDHL